MQQYRYPDLLPPRRQKSKKIEIKTRLKIFNKTVAKEEAEANSRLFECSQELLQMVKDMIEEYRTDDSDIIDSSLINQAKSLIKKATTI